MTYPIKPTSMLPSDTLRPFSEKDTVRLPYSKSIGARYLMASCFAGTLPMCQKFNDCDDLRVIQKALLDLLKNDEWSGTGEPPLDIHASGTAFRFVTAAVASTPGADFLVTGTPRLCSRPMAPLLEVLRKAGASIEARGENGTGPYRIIGRRLKGGDFEIRGDVSSQFISALMLVAPTWKKGMRLRFTTPLVSRPYVEMTAGVMEQFGASVTLREDGVEVRPGEYLAPRSFRVEADWSAAGFFYEAAALSRRQTDIAGLLPAGQSLQGDAETPRFFEKLGVVSEFHPEGVSIRRTGTLPDWLEADLSANPDLAPAFAVACVLGGVRFRFTGVGNLRLKECDRLAALQTEFRKMGFSLTTGDDSIEWTGALRDADSHVEIETYDDHRIAMAFAIGALRYGELRIKNPGVVDKSFEDFWRQIPATGLVCRREGDVMVVENPELIPTEKSTNPPLKDEKK